MDERHRIISQAGIYLQKNPLGANLNIGELRDMARDSSMTDLTELRMQRYAGNI